MDNRKKNILLGVLIVGVISMTVAFAALSTTLNISGTAGIPTTRWDIHFANGTDNTSGTHANGKTNRGKIENVNFQATSITGFTVTLYQPNDEVVYNFDIVNAGTIDGQLDNFSKTLTCNSSDCSMITYTIDCEDDSHQDANQSDYILASGQSVSCEMKIKYNDQTNTGNGVYNQGAVNATASATWLYKQVESSSNSGGSGSGSSNQYATDFTGTYGYVGQGSTTDTANGWPSSLNSEWQIYLRQNTSTNVEETCGVFPSGTTCLTIGDYSNDFEDVTNGGSNITTTAGLEATGLKGYALAKAEEMLTNGASSCDVDSISVDCDMPSGVFCHIGNDGIVYCGDSDGNFCNIYSGGHGGCNF